MKSDNFAARKIGVPFTAALAFMCLVSACSMTDSIYTAGGAAAGAVAGGLVGQRYASNNPAAPVIGAAAGAALGGIGTSLLLSATKQERKTAFAQGYDRGASDSIKRQYWILQNLQKDKRRGESPYRLTYYRFVIPPDPNAPVKTVPQDIAIPIYE